MGNNFQVLRFDSKFGELFQPQVGDPRQTRVHLHDLTHKPQVKYLQSYLQQLKCQWMIVEEKYVDRDYLIDYAEYYVRCFRQYLKHCRRVHFFTSDLSSFAENDDVLLKAIVNQDSEVLRLLSVTAGNEGCSGEPQTPSVSPYLGFCILKPLPNAVVGRTVLKTWPDTDGTAHRFFPVTRDYDANLFGLKLHVKDTLVSQEQDTVLAACATTALWSALHKLGPVHQTAIPTPSEITKSATKYYHAERPIPTRGLAVEQICSAILENGFVPEVYEVKENLSVASLIRAYVAGGIPVILGIGMGKPTSLGEDDHAVCVCGYRLEKRRVLSRETHDVNRGFASTGQRVSEFYAQDDNLGPFTNFELELRFAKGKKKRNPLRFMRPHKYTSSRKADRFLPSVIIVPLYHKIRVRYTDLEPYLAFLDGYFAGIFSVRDEHNADWNAEWDIRILDVGSYREWILSATIDDDVKRQLLVNPTPKYLWLSTASMDGQKLLSVVTDATALERSFLIDRLVFHSHSIREKITACMEAVDKDQLMVTDYLEKKRGLPLYQIIRFLRNEFLNS